MTDFKHAVQQYEQTPDGKDHRTDIEIMLAHLTPSETAMAEISDDKGTSLRVEFVCVGIDPCTNLPMLQINQNDHPYRKYGEPVRLFEAAAELAFVAQAFITPAKEIRTGIRRPSLYDPGKGDIDPCTSLT